MSDEARTAEWLEDQQGELPAATVHMGEDNEDEDEPHDGGNPASRAYSTHSSSALGMMPPAYRYTQGGARSLPVQWDSRGWDGESVSTGFRPSSTLGRSVLQTVLEAGPISSDVQKRRLSPDKGHRNAQSQSSTPSKKKRGGQKLGCPVDMGAVYLGRQRQWCRPGGMELRHVWQHVNTVHLGCETCGLKLRSTEEALEHLSTAKDDPAKCVRLTTGRSPYEIGIPMIAKLGKIYKNKANKSLDDKDRWIKWWEIIHPGTRAPNPLHGEPLGLSTADIPTIQDALFRRWNETSELPRLGDEHRESFDGVVGHVLHLLSPVELQGSRPAPTISSSAGRGPEVGPSLDAVEEIGDQDDADFQSFSLALASAGDLFSETTAESRAPPPDDIDLDTLSNFDFES